jgi:hypothetical protein
MNALTTSNVASHGLVPTNMREAMELAQMMAQAGFLAKELQTPGGALFVIEQAMRWNMSPFAVAMETSFIQGKPMFSGKITAAAAVSSGAVSGRLTYTYSGDGDNRTVLVSGHVRGEPEPSTVSVRLGDAKTNNRMWQTQPDQQLAYHGSRVWARRHTPWVMLGVMSPEEFDEAQAEPRAVPNLEPAPAPLPDAEFPWIAMDGTELQVSGKTWLKQLGKALSHLREADAIRLWRAERGGMLAAIHDSGEEGAALIADAERAIAIRIAEIEENAA